MRQSDRIALALSAVGMGDALAYAVLPLYAAHFGLSLGAVGILLGINRLVRPLLYTVMGRVCSPATMSQLSRAATLVAGLSTLLLACGSGLVVLLIARVAWGWSFATLKLAMVASSTRRAKQAGIRLGVANAIRQAGPLFATTAGLAVVLAAGPRTAFGAVASVAVVGVWLVRRLAPLEMLPSRRTSGVAQQFRPQTPDAVAFVTAFVADGVLAATIAPLLSAELTTASALWSAGLVLAARRVFPIVLGPSCGHLLDRVGSRSGVIVGAAVVGLGIAGVLLGGLVTGAVVAMGGRALVSIALPLQTDRDLPALSRLATWTDLGSALGPWVGLWCTVHVLVPELLAGTLGLLAVVLLGFTARTKMTAVEVVGS